MTREQLVAMERQLSAQIQSTREQVLRLEGYRLAIVDIIKADDDTAAKAAADAAAKEAANQATETKPENDDAQATA